MGCNTSLTNDINRSNTRALLLFPRSFLLSHQMTAFLKIRGFAFRTSEKRRVYSMNGQKFQVPSSKFQVKAWKTSAIKPAQFWNLELGTWSLELGTWNLELLLTTISLFFPKSGYNAPL